MNIKKWALGMSFVLVAAPMSFAQSKDSDTEAGIFSGAGAALALVLGQKFFERFMSDKKFRADIIDTVKDLNAKEFVNNVVAKVKSKAIDVVMKVLVGGLEKLPTESIAQFALDREISIQGLSQSDLERIAKGEIEGMAQEKIEGLTKAVGDKIQTQLKGITDFIQRKTGTIGEQALKRIAKLTGEDPQVIKAVLEAALPKSLKNDSKLLGKSIEGAILIEEISIDDLSDVLRGSEVEFVKGKPTLKTPDPVKEIFNARVKFREEYGALYKKGGRTGAQRVLDDLKTQFDKAHPGGSAREFINEYEKVLDLQKIYEKYGSADLEKMPIDDLFKPGIFERQSFAEREMISAINERITVEVY
ncbi:MAG: hypothetical protein WD068_03160 [Candidatus Babeliales bacterium]